MNKIQKIKKESKMTDFEWEYVVLEETINLCHKKLLETGKPIAAIAEIALKQLENEILPF